MLFLQPIIHKVHLMTEAAALTFDLKTVGAMLTAVAAIFYAASDHISDLKAGKKEDESIKTELVQLRNTINREDQSMKDEVIRLRQTIDKEHNAFKSNQANLIAELAAFKLIEAERHSNQAIEINASKTNDRYMQRDMEKLLKSMETLIVKFDAHTADTLHPPMP